MMIPELVIFDCDGVLIDSERIACDVDAGELSACGYEISTEEVARRFAGVPHKEMYAAIEAETGWPLPAGFADRVHRRIVVAYNSGLQAIPGVAEVLKRLTQPFCVASSSDPGKLRLGLANTGLLEFFEPHVFSTVQVARGKPAPDLFLFAAGQFDIAPEKCLVIEDSVAGVTAARAAAMPVVGFTGGSHCGPGHSELLVQAGAAKVFDRFEQILDVANGRART